MSGLSRSRARMVGVAGGMKRVLASVALGVGLMVAAAPGQAQEKAAASAASTFRGPPSVAPLAERLIDAVVNISTTQTVGGTGPTAAIPKVPKGSPFEEFFDDFFSSKGGGSRPERKVSSLGSGFVIDGKEGLVVTNYHVIEGADEIVVNFHDGSKLKVDKVLGKDSKSDLAVLKVTPKKPLPAVKFGDSSGIHVGDWVMAIGNPFGLGGSVTVGIISAKQRDINSGPYDDYLQTDAAINKGNSGGPLFGMDGDVVGVNTAIISPSGGSIGIGFAIPAESAVAVVDQLRQYGEVRRGWLGVKIQTVTDEISSSVGVPENQGALIATVTPDGPAAKAGIEAGDVVLKFDGKDVSSMRGLPRIVAQTQVGKTVDVELMRKGEKKVVKVVVGRLADDDVASDDDSTPKPQARTLVGLKLAPMSDDLKRKYGLKEQAKGVVITEVEAGSVAAQRELVAGNVIVEAGGQAVATPADVSARIDAVRKSGRKQILLSIEDAKGGFRSVALPFK